ncbi:MAG: hypothetical protein O2855_09115 [Planctomycetota bacterium]|nr:hypothetical protein [Planctomycetota bacterium]
MEVEEAVKVARLVDLIDDVALVSLAATRALPQIDRQAGHDLVDHAATIGESLAPASEWIQAIRDTVDERYLTSMPALQLRQFHLAMSGPAGERNADRVFYLNSAWLQCCLARMRMVERELSGVRSELADSVEVSRWEDLDSPEVLARIGTEHGQVGKLVAHIRSRPLLAAAAVRGSDKPWSMEFHARTGMQALLQIEPGSPMLSMFFYGSDGEGAPAEVEGEVARWCGVEARVSSGRAEFDSAAVRGAVSPRDALHGAATMIVSGHSFTLVKSS